MLSLFPISLEFPFTPLSEVEATSLICLRRMRAMDTARIAVNIRPEDINQVVAAGSPLRVRWYGKGFQDEFVGYVHSFKPIMDGYSQKTVIMAVSAAYPMFDEPGRTFQGVGIHNVAEEIANDYRFQLETEPHPMIQDQILQQDESDWSFLQRLADKWGYVLLFDGVTLIFRPLLSLLEERYRRAERERTDIGVSAEASSVISFRPSFSAAGATPMAQSQGAGVDPLSVQQIEWNQANTGQPFAQQSTEYSITSELEGELVTIAMDAKNRFPYTADMVVQTPVNKGPLDIYQITHEGDRMTWVVQCMKHIVTGDNYIGEAILGSDGNDYVESAMSTQLDVTALIRMTKGSARETPVIVPSRPYYSGSGASVVMQDQRWKSLVMRGANEGSN